MTDNRYFIQTDVKLMGSSFIASYAITHAGREIYSESMTLPGYTSPRSRLTAIHAALQKIPSNSTVVLVTSDDYAEFAFKFMGTRKELKNLEELNLILRQRKRMASCYVQKMPVQKRITYYTYGHKETEQPVDRGLQVYYP